MKVFLIAATTADGKIGLAKDHHADWTSKEDKQLFVKLTKESGVMIMGMNTFKTIGRGLPGRKTIVYSYDSKVIEGVEGDVEVTSDEPEKLLQELSDQGHKSVAICGGAQIYSLFLSKGLVDELYLTVEPVLFGDGISLAEGVSLTNLQLIETRQLNENTVLLHYSVKR
nr:RibD C-terminal domain protein [uncultured bacterium]